MDNNQQQIDINTLTVEQLKQLLSTIEATIGRLELEKQTHMVNHFQISAQLVEKMKVAQQKPINMPKLKKITLPKLGESEQVTYTPNIPTAVT